MPPVLDAESPNFLIFDLARLFRAEFERRVAATGLGVTPAEARVLAHAARAGAVRQHPLAERLGMAPMSLTVFVDRLEPAGLVERVADPQDGRAKLVRLTAAAGPALADIAAAGELRNAARGDMDPADWQRFKALAGAARDDLASARATRAA